MFLTMSEKISMLIKLQTQRERSNKPETKKNNMNIGKIIQLVIGYILLIPVAFSILCFISRIIDMYKTEPDGTLLIYIQHGFPIGIFVYCGLLAIAGAYLIKTDK